MAYVTTALLAPEEPLEAEEALEEVEAMEEVGVSAMAKLAVWSKIWLMFLSKLVNQHTFFDVKVKLALTHVTLTA